MIVHTWCTGDDDDDDGDDDDDDDDDGDDDDDDHDDDYDDDDDVYDDDDDDDGHDNKHFKSLCIDIPLRSQANTLGLFRGCPSIAFWRTWCAWMEVGRQKSFWEWVSIL